MMRPALLTLILSFALLAKALVPAGWMPTGKSAFEITICTGMGMDRLWLDHDGKLHKQNPAGNQDDSDEQTCPYAALAAAADLPRAALLAMPIHASASLHLVESKTATIGHGLAAPPPPSTGPPILN